VERGVLIYPRNCLGCNSTGKALARRILRLAPSLEFIKKTEPVVAPRFTAAKIIEDHAIEPRTFLMNYPQHPINPISKQVGL
jgi:hypothetical protein